ncbi:MAG: hypothetical protein FWG25_10560, partial [Promicromonosporaceae bacterium]|nr:hypothetical protein [Promicromonosporaceae bacterium]
HLMSDVLGDYPIGTLNKWERQVLAKELDRKDQCGKPAVFGWYRNPSRPAVDALGVAYRDEATGNWRSMQPDFLMFEEVDGEVLPSIIDPHSDHWDNSPDGNMHIL